MTSGHGFEDGPALMPSSYASWDDQNCWDGDRAHHWQTEEMRRSNSLAEPRIYTSASPATFPPEEGAVHSYPSAFHNFQSPTRRRGDRQAYYTEYGSEQRPAWAAVAQRSVCSSLFPTSYPIPLETVVSRTSSPLLVERSRTMTRRWISLNSTQDSNYLNRQPAENDLRSIEHSPVGSPTHDTLYYLQDQDPINLCTSNSNLPTSSGCSIPKTLEQLSNRQDHDSCFAGGTNSTSYYSGGLEQIPCSSGASQQSPVTTLSTPVSEDSGSDTGRVHLSANQKRRHRLSKEVYERMTPEQFRAHRREHTRQCSKQYREREKQKRESYNRELEEQATINEERRERFARLERQRFLLRKCLESRGKIKSGP